MVKAGIIDPAKVVRIALQDAASVAGLLITTEAMVAEKPEKKAPPMPRRLVAWAAWATWTSKSSPHRRMRAPRRVTSAAFHGVGTAVRGGSFARRRGRTEGMDHCGTMAWNADRRRAPGGLPFVSGAGGPDRP